MKQLLEYLEAEINRWEHIKRCCAGGVHVQRWMTALEVIRELEQIKEQVKKREGKAHENMEK